MAPNYQVTDLWYDHFSRYRLSYEGDTAGLSISTTMSENGSEIIVKVVNSSEEARTLKVGGNWTGISGGEYQYYAPGDLKTANSMDNKNAVALKTVSLEPDNGEISLGIEPLSAGVLVIRRN